MIFKELLEELSSTEDDNTIFDIQDGRYARTFSSLELKNIENEFCFDMDRIVEYDPTTKTITMFEQQPKLHM